ncbi:MAG TPA: histidine kinase dimerization/phospho-acceptor domain-containing protein, partial [Opitutus sp.]|nr:histidine kinase dimerization/phospho-acceptor domain-containing protein [Opitutus sp.]
MKNSADTFLALSGGQLRETAIAVRPATRRVWFYWLLLLLPALAAGGVAFQLLRREQARIAQQSAEVIDARQAAAAARARLIAENVELLVGDVQEGLLGSLAAQPESELEAFMNEWEAGNPLVKTTFIARENGELVRPGPRDTDDNARGFIRRFSATFQSQPPWRKDQAPAAAEERVMALQEQIDARARREVASNVAQVQSARRDVQELLKARNYQRSSADLSSAGTPPSAEADSAPSPASLRNEPANTPKPATEAAAKAVLAAPAPSMRDRRGWTAFPVEGRLHLLGWVQVGNETEIRGLELDLAALVSRLANALPTDAAEGEGFVLRDERGRAIHQVGGVSRGEAKPAATVPLANTMLAGWAVTAHLPLAMSSDEDGSGFFVVGAILVGIFVAAILAGGSLLLWQARRSEQEAAQKTSFVANVSHEFKTPLTTIRLYSELLEQGRVNDAQQGGDYLRTIGRETERLARLVNNALDFSRLEQGQKKFARERFDLVAEVTRLLETHTPRIAEAGLTLKREFPLEPIYAAADRDAVEQIVLNLIDNACKYAAEGGEIIVSIASTTGKGVELRVADRGPGVPTEQREKIFEKFHRV